VVFFGYKEIPSPLDDNESRICYLGGRNQAVYSRKRKAGMIPKMHFLIVDNQPRARQGMKALLGAWYPGSEFREAANGYEAVQLVEEFQPDVILTDARMPKMGGLEAVRQIKAKPCRIKIIVLSMYPDLQAEALDAGADAFVSKSDPPEKLRETLVQLIRDVESRRKKAQKKDLAQNEHKPT
jgi:two-component system response regulator AtoC